MQKKAEELKYEEAEELKEKYITIENYRSKSTVVTPTLHNIDVFAIEDDEHSAYINFMHIGNGAIKVQAFTFEYKKRLEETKEELLGLGIVEMRERFKSEAKEIKFMVRHHSRKKSKLPFHREAIRKTAGSVGDERQTV